MCWGMQSEFLRHLGEARDLMKSSAGLSAAIYTENADVEDEVNGIYTYDRKVRPESDIRQNITYPCQLHVLSLELSKHTCFCTTLASYSKCSSLEMRHAML